MASRRRGFNPVVRYSRDYRRPPRWGMGLPPHKPPTRWRRFLARVVDPVFYLKAVIAVCTLALVVLPLGADAVNAALKPARRGADDCRILSVIDGDTLAVWCGAEGVMRARLVGFDAPELFSPACSAEYAAAQRASWALRGMIFQAREVTLEIRGSDRYDRALTTLSLDGRPVAARMIAAGHARAYDGGRRHPWCTDGTAPSRT